MAEGRRARRRDLGGRRAFYTEDAAHNARGQGRGAGAGRDTLKLELGSGRTQSREENILKRKGFRRGENLCFLFQKRKRKKKENVSSKNAAREPVVHQTGKETRAMEDARGGGPVSEELYL